MSEFTPSVDKVRDLYADARAGVGEWTRFDDSVKRAVEAAYAEFDRMIAKVRAEALLAEVAEYRRRVNEVHEAAIGLVGAAWDDGNGAGLDGWVGPGRGAGEVDAEAEHARTRFVHKADRKLDEVEAVGDE